MIGTWKIQARFAKWFARGINWDTQGTDYTRSRVTLRDTDEKDPEQKIILSYEADPYRPTGPGLKHQAPIIITLREDTINPDFTIDLSNIQGECAITIISKGCNPDRRTYNA